MGGKYGLFSLSGIGAAGVIAVENVHKGGPAALSAVAAAIFIGFALWGWIAAYRRLQAFEDIPLSKIATAAQGYARFEGRAAPFPGARLEAPMTHLACCWYSYKLENIDQNGNVASSEQDTSEWSFVLSDGSGECVVDPVGAKIAVKSVNRHSSKQLRWTEYTICPRDEVCVIGAFRTSGMTVTEHDIEELAGARIVEWKKDLRALVSRFQLSQPFKIEEWERVRQAARQEVEAELAKNPPQGQNQVSEPKDGRPYLITSEPREQLERELKLWAWAHAACFVAGAGALAAWAVF